MEKRLKISKELAASLMTMPNIKNQPLQEGDVVRIGSYVENVIAPNGKDKGYTDHYYTATVERDGIKAVKIPVAELLKMTGATTQDAEGNFDVAPVFSIVSATPRKVNGEIMFPLTQYTGYLAFLKKVQAGEKSFSQEEVQKIRKSGLACDPEDYSKAMQDYKVEAEG